jgi:exonuclease III
MRLIAWNIRVGGGPRSVAIFDAIAAHKPDVVVIGEYRPVASAALIAALIRQGLTHAVDPLPPPRYGGVAVLSRFPIERLALSDALPPWRYIPVQVQDVEIHAAYAPNLDGTHEAYWRAVREGLARDVARPVLFVGDLNTGETGKDAPASPPFPCSDHFCALGDLGFVDLWRQQHGDEAREWTYHGRVNPSRIDHALASPSFTSRVTRCVYRHEEREARLSDHSMLIVEWQ